ncbi:pyroglutamyl-peptidase I [Microbacterium sp. A93]|uniref:pyroglutamyl-peptidase I n=1 Tax=Microbacterium sp. A93 TaxID=3450716 RepID=UPI003F4225DA
MSSPHLAAHPGRTLLTGFEPFGGERHNPSWPAAREAARTLRRLGVDAVAERLPCTFAGSSRVLETALARHRPGVVIACGLAGGRSHVAVERVAVNLQDARIPDNAGHQPAGDPIDDAGPAAYFSSLPVKRTVAALHGARIPAELSLSAGSFVCNHVFYEVMRRAEAQGGSVRSAGFIHLPWDEGAPRRAAEAEPWPALPAADLARALVIAAQEAARPASDLQQAAGALY